MRIVLTQIQFARLRLPLSSSSNHTAPLTKKNRFLIFSAYLWIPSSIGNTMPLNALVGGRDSDGSPIYVGRSPFQGDELPCKIIPNQNAAYVSYDGAEHLVERFDVKPVQIRFGRRKQ